MHKAENIPLGPPESKQWFNPMPAIKRKIWRTFQTWKRLISTFLFVLTSAFWKNGCWNKRRPVGFSTPTFFTASTGFTISSRPFLSSRKQRALWGFVIQRNRLFHNGFGARSVWTAAYASLSPVALLKWTSVRKLFYEICSGSFVSSRNVALVD